MNEIFAVSLASMQQDLGSLDRVALNLANVSTPGYKRQVFAPRPFAEVLQAAGVSQAAAEGDATPTAGSQALTDARPGTVTTTGQPLDVALESDGYFEVQTENGLAYTRQGNFHVDARGRLVTAQNHPVMGMNGEIVLATRTPVIDAVGKITEPHATTGPAAGAPGTPIAQLKVVTFDDPRTLQRLGDGLVAAGAGLTVVRDGSARIRQGALENSNVNSMHEMVQLMQTVRHFESMQKVVQGYDELLGIAIRKLGDLA